RVDDVLRNLLYRIHDQPRAQFRGRGRAVFALRSAFYVREGPAHLAEYAMRSGVSRAVELSIIGRIDVVGDQNTSRRILGYKGDVKFSCDALGGPDLRGGFRERRERGIGRTHRLSRPQFVGVGGLRVRVFGDLADDLRGGIVVVAEIRIVFQQLGFKERLKIVGKGAVFVGRGDGDLDGLSRQMNQRGQL